jgi:hypothetical protein
MEGNMVTIFDAAAALEKDNFQLAKEILNDLIQEQVTVELENEELISHVIAEGLLRRIDKKMLEEKSIYLQQFDIPQIDLFYKMAQAYPQVGESHKIANRLIAKELMNRETAVLFDIGIGKGKQYEGLLESLGNSSSLKSLTVVGLDPDQGNVDDAEKILSNHDWPFDFSYLGITDFLETMPETYWKQLESLSDEGLFVNGAYALHHIAHEIGDRSFRGKMINRLAAMNPVLMTLLEPNSDHDEENLGRRLQNCWNHFSVVFDLVDQSEVEKEAKFMIKHKFFGREMEDMFGNNDFFRSERHEPVESWVIRLHQAGMQPYPTEEIKIELPSYCTTDRSEGCIELGYKDTSLIGVFAYGKAETWTGV